MEMGTLEGVIGFVGAGVGIAAMPESFIASISKGRKVLMLPFPKEVATLGTYIVSSQQTASPLANDFVDHCYPGGTASDLSRRDKRTQPGISTPGYRQKRARSEEAVERNFAVTKSNVELDRHELSAAL